ncbi:MAG: mannose-1-phosphate guanylyltransferase [Chloroflexota bacterium]
MNHLYAVIMAGGSGTRLWPVSRQNHPKHTLPILGHLSLFQTTVERLQGLFLFERILVVTTEAQYAKLKEQVPEIPRENFLLEPEPKGTASVVGLAAAVINSRDPDAIMTVLPSDHHISNTDLFHHIIKIAMDVANKGYLVTLGITPTFPATGYGYIQRGESILEEFPYPVYHVLKFKEKPGEIQAREMVANKDHSWNSGIFTWRSDRILEEFALQMPALRNKLNEITEFWGSPTQAIQLRNVWNELKVETIDYGIMENATRVAVLPASGLMWNDVGSWDSLFDVLMPDENGNIVFSGGHMGINTHTSLIYGNHAGKLVVTIGVDDLIIVDSGDVLLVCKKDQAQKVRQAVKNLENSERENYL